MSPVSAVLGGRIVSGPSQHGGTLQHRPGMCCFVSGHRRTVSLVAHHASIADWRILDQARPPSQELAPQVRAPCLLSHPPARVCLAIAGWISILYLFIYPVRLGRHSHGGQMVHSGAQWQADVLFGPARSQGRQDARVDGLEHLHRGPAWWSLLGMRLAQIKPTILLRPHFSQA
jgi:hypothetical protein